MIGIVGEHRGTITVQFGELAAAIPTTDAPPNIRDLLQVRPLTRHAIALMLLLAERGAAVNDDDPLRVGTIAQLPNIDWSEVASRAQAAR